MKKKVALITGITGQDGSYLTEYLLKKNYIVHGIKRRSSSFNTSRIEHLFKTNFRDSKNLFLHFGDLSDTTNIYSIISSIYPDEIYNLAAQSHVKVSFETPEYTANVDAIGTLRILEAIKSLSKKKMIKFYQASTSEMYGNVKKFPINHKTEMKPVSPYGCSKLFAHNLVKNYRDAYNLFAVNGILFNHESPRRGETFVSRKITLGIKNILEKKQTCIYLGNLNAKRDWGHAEDYVSAMWKMLNQKKPRDFIIATGQSYSVREFVERCFKYVGIEINWKYKGLNEIGLSKKDKKVLVKVDPFYFRPHEIHNLIGDFSEAKKILKWQPKRNFDMLVEDMMKNDLGK